MMFSAGSLVAFALCVSIYICLLVTKLSSLSLNPGRSEGSRHNALPLINAKQRFVRLDSSALDLEKQPKL